MPSMEYPGELSSNQLSDSAAAICLTSFRSLSVQTAGFELGLCLSSSRVSLAQTAQVTKPGVGTLFKAANL